jgi:hypothetical protein
VTPREWFARVGTGRGIAALRSHHGRLRVTDETLSFTPDSESLSGWSVPLDQLRIRRNNRWATAKLALTVPAIGDVRMTVGLQPMRHLQTAQTDAVIAGWTADFLEDLDARGVTVER